MSWAETPEPSNRDEQQNEEARYAPDLDSDPVGQEEFSSEIADVADNEIEQTENSTFGNDADTGDKRPVGSRLRWHFSPYLSGQQSSDRCGCCGNRSMDAWKSGTWNRVNRARIDFIFGLFVFVAPLCLKLQKEQAHAACFFCHSLGFGVKYNPERFWHKEHHHLCFISITVPRPAHWMKWWMRSLK